MSLNGKRKRAGQSTSSAEFEDAVPDVEFSAEARSWSSLKDIDEGWLIQKLVVKAEDKGAVSIAAIRLLLELKGMIGKKALDPATLDEKIRRVLAGETGDGQLNEIPDADGP